MVSIAVSQARAALPELLSRVEHGEEITITRHGRPVAVLVHPQVLTASRPGSALGDVARIRELLAEAASRPAPQGAGLTEQRAEELIREIRTGRDAR